MQSSKIIVTFGLAFGMATGVLLFGQAKEADAVKRTVLQRGDCSRQLIWHRALGIAAERGLCRSLPLASLIRGKRPTSTWWRGLRWCGSRNRKIDTNAQPWVRVFRPYLAVVNSNRSLGDG